MMADDMGIGDTSAYQFFTGNEDGEQLYTPQMERLANMGILFTDGHTPPLAVRQLAMVCLQVDMHFATA